MMLTWREDRERRTQIQTRTSRIATSNVAAIKVVVLSKNNFGAVLTTGTDIKAREEADCLAFSDLGSSSETVFEREPVDWFESFWPATEFRTFLFVVGGALTTS
jgi:hypothetical protein